MQPTVNINIQPDPITYQVEIETRVPIAFPLENALLNGLTNAAAVVSAQDGQQGLGAGAAGNRRQLLLGKIFSIKGTFLRAPCSASNPS